MSLKPEHNNEIIIVRRNLNSEEESHHGGVWKIAYADFMTAMMAFFLVMWLINATDEKTKLAVASYFNPIKLVDNQAAPKGVREIEKTLVEPTSQQGAETQDAVNGASANSVVKDNDFIELGVEEEMLLKRHSTVDPEPTQSNSPMSSRGGEAYRDPFSPDYWTGQVADVQAKDTPREPEKAQQYADSRVERDQNEGRPNKSAELVDGLKQALAKSSTGQHDKEPLPIANVIPVEGGIMVELLDNERFNMFAIGSARPSNELITVLNSIAGVLKGRDEDIIISGHTDARPFRNSNYDNWQLSTDRAQEAYSLLLKNGVKETRFARIEGYADRKLKNRGNSHAPENRRIEILLRPHHEAQ